MMIFSLAAQGQRHLVLKVFDLIVLEEQEREFSRGRRPARVKSFGLGAEAA